MIFIDIMRNERIQYISLASVLSAIAVVFLHANECAGNFSYARYWVTANIIHSIFIFAVPLFFMISGAMLLDFNKKYNLKTYFSKRIYKTLIPYIFWSTFGILFQFYYLNSISSIDLAYIVNSFISGSAITVYWFFIPLFELYILFPIFTYFVDNKKHCLYFMCLLLLVNCFVSFYHVHIIGYSFFAVFGFYIHKYGINKKIRYFIYALAVIGFLANTIGSYYISIMTGKLFRSYIEYTFIPAMLYPLGLFVFIKYELVKIMTYEIISRIVLFLDFYTFGIYLIHWYILQILIKIFNININSIIYRLGSPFIVIIICILIIRFLREIPLIKKIVP